MNYKKALIWFLAAGFGLYMIMYLVNVWNRVYLQSNGIETVGVITREHSSHRRHNDVEYKYVVNGQEYRGHDQLHYDLPCYDHMGAPGGCEGSRCFIKYDPDDPGNSIFTGLAQQ